MIGEKLVMTMGVNDLIADNEEFAKGVCGAIARFKNKDWGDLCDEDKKTNDNAEIFKDRILARYNISPKPIYIITEWDRSVTTILFPSEY